MLCGDSFAQSTSFSGPSADDPELVFERSVAGPSSTLHGIGCVNLSNFNPQLSYQKAFEHAVEDLNSNMEIIVYAETFNTSYDYRRFNEFSIRESVTAEDVVKIDSSVSDGIVYFRVEPRNRPSAAAPLAEKATSLIPTWLNVQIDDPVETENWYFSSGFYDLSAYNPNNSWGKAKQRALGRLAEFISTNIDVLQKSKENSLSGMTYSTTKVYFKNVVITNRSIVGKRVHLIIAVPKGDVITF